jgi:hypothetical protein
VGQAFVVFHAPKISFQRRAISSALAFISF